MASSRTNNVLPPGLVSNLQDVLLRRKGGDSDAQGNTDSVKEDASNDQAKLPSSVSEVATVSERENGEKPIVLVTNGDGIESLGLVYLVEALVLEGLYNVQICAPQSDKSTSGHAVTRQESVAAISTEINGVAAYEVSGTPTDCVSLALSGALFSWSKPVLVISGINQGPTCGHDMFYSGAVSGAREAVVNGVPALSISLNWKKGESKESDFKDAVAVCMPLVRAMVKGIEQGSFPESCLLRVELPTSPSGHKGFKLTRQSMWKSSLSWNAVKNRYPVGHFLSNQQSLGLQMAQLGRDASAAGAARRLTTQRKNLEVVESVGSAGNSGTSKVKKFFRLELLPMAQKEVDEDLDFRAIENGYVAVTPISLSPHVDSHLQLSTSDWMSLSLAV